MAGGDLLAVNNLKVHFHLGGRGLMRPPPLIVRAVDDVSFAIKPGECLGLVGESGCGKTTTGRALLRILPPSGGEVNYRGREGNVTDLAQLRERDLVPFRRDIRMIFQDPYSSLNPRLPVLELVGEPLKVNHLAKGSELEDRVADLLRKVGLRPEYMRRYPHAFSGGERQRIGIARALATNPRLVICDEAVSALDVSVQAQTLNLLRDLQEEFGLTYLFIAHDLSVVEFIADRVAVMYAGKIVEIGSVEEIYNNPRHPYTEALLSAVPTPEPRRRHHASRIRLTGEVADPANTPSGCAFHPRCRYAQDRCRIDTPPLRAMGADHLAACHFSKDLRLKGITPDALFEEPPVASHPASDQGTPS